MAHRPCKRRRFEERDGVAMDRCYAICFEEMGDMPCVYCVDGKPPKPAPPSPAQGRSRRRKPKRKVSSE